MTEQINRSMTSASELQLLQVNDPVIVNRQNRNLEGIVAHVGPVQFDADDDWVGVRLTGSSAGLGKNNGTVHGVSYFTCPPHCGIFVRSSVVQKWRVTRLEALELSRELQATTTTEPVEEAAVAVTPSSSVSLTATPTKTASLPASPAASSLSFSPMVSTEASTPESIHTTPSAGRRTFGSSYTSPIRQPKGRRPEPKSSLTRTRNGITTAAAGRTTTSPNQTNSKSSPRTSVAATSPNQTNSKSPHASQQDKRQNQQQHDPNEAMMLLEHSRQENQALKRQLAETLLVLSQTRHEIAEMAHQQQQQQQQDTRKNQRSTARAVVIEHDTSTPTSSSKFPEQGRNLVAVQAQLAETLRELAQANKEAHQYQSRLKELEMTHQQEMKDLTNKLEEYLTALVAARKETRNAQAKLKDAEGVTKNYTAASKLPQDEERDVRVLNNRLKESQLLLSQAEQEIVQANGRIARLQVSVVASQSVKQSLVNETVTAAVAAATAVMNVQLRAKELEIRGLRDQLEDSQRKVATLNWELDQQKSSRVIDKEFKFYCVRP